MKYLSLLKVLLVSVMVIGIPSCSDIIFDDCMCCDLEGGNFNAEVEVYGFEPLRVQFIKNHAWTNYQIGEIASGDHGLSFGIHPFLKEIVSLPVYKSGSWFVTSAYACSPAYSYHTSQQLVDVKITSTSDYDLEHPAGTNLIEYFKVRASADINEIPLSEFLGTYPNEFILQGSQLFLSKSPESIGKHSFTFEIELSNTTFRLSSIEMLIE